MDLKTLKQSFSQLPQIDATATQLQNSGTHIQWKGLVGSSKSICAAVLAEQTPGHHLFILPDKEQAAYFLNDLEELYPEDKRILFIQHHTVCPISWKKQIMPMLWHALKY